MKPYLTVEEHKANSFDLELFDDIRDFILDLGEVEELSKANIIEYKHKNIFCSIQTQIKNQIIVFTKIDIPNPLPLIAEDKTGKGHLGPGNLRLNIASKKDFEEAKTYLRKSYEEN